MGFQDLSPERLKEVTKRGGEAKRTPELKWAWANKEILREEAEEIGKLKTARKYKINVRSLYRIIYGK